MNKKITFSELAELLAQKQDITKREAELFLRELMAIMTETLASGEVLRINALGVFKPTWVDERASVNVQTGAPYIIPGHYKLSFTPSKAVRETINEPFACFCVEELPDDAPIVAETQSVDEMGDDAPDNAPDNGNDVIIPADDSAVNVPDAPLDMEPPVVEKSLDDMVEEQPDTVQSEAVQPDTAQSDAPLKDDNAQAIENIADQTPADDLSNTSSEIQQMPVEERVELPSPASVVADEDVALQPTVAEGASATSHAYRKGMWIGGIIASSVIVALLFIVALFFPQFVPLLTLPQDDASAVSAVDTLLPISSTHDVLPLDTLQHSVDTTSVLPAHSEVAPIVTTPLAVDTIRRGVFLTNISLKYYGHKCFWVYVYEENKHIIANPNNVPIGTVIAIPQPQKYGIDANDTTAINVALQKASHIKELYD